VAPVQAGIRNVARRLRHGRKLGRVDPAHEYEGTATICSSHHIWEDDGELAVHARLIIMR
jgi:hypothetical protein